MINAFGKLLVLAHTVMSLAALTWGVFVFMQARDFGWAEPARDPLQFGADGTPSKWTRRASQVDKSRVAIESAAAHRDRHYSYVKPAIDKLQSVEPFLADNHLFYVAQLERLKNAESKDPLEIRRLANNGMALEKKIVGKPEFEADAVEGITKSFNQYLKDLGELDKEITSVQADIVKTNKDGLKFVRELTGTGDDGKYIQPGLYELIELEYKAQTRYKEELEDIKPRWSIFVEQARLHMIRRTDLEATLQKLKSATPAPKKKL